MTPQPNSFCVLVVSAEPSIGQTRLLLLEEAGHAAHMVESPAKAREILQLDHFDAAVLDHTLSKDERGHLIHFMRQFAPAIRILLLHKSGADSGADLHLDSRDGPDALKRALKMLLHPGQLSNGQHRTSPQAESQTSSNSQHAITNVAWHDSMRTVSLHF